MNEGDLVQYFLPAYGYWRFGHYVREIRRGKHKGWHIVKIQRKTTTATYNKKFRPEHVKPHEKKASNKDND